MKNLIVVIEALLAAGKGGKNGGKKQKKDKKKKEKKKDKKTDPKPSKGPKPSKKPKKDKKEKKKKKKNKPGNIVPIEDCKDAIFNAFELAGSGAQKFKNGFQYTCDNGKPSIGFIICKFGAENDVELWKNGKTKHEPTTNQKTKITCKPVG